MNIELWAIRNFYRCNKFEKSGVNEDGLMHGAFFPTSGSRINYYPSMTSRFSFRFTDMLQIVVAWPAILAACYRYNDGQYSDFIVPTDAVIAAAVIFSLWLLTGWLLALRICNGLEFESPFKRGGVILLAWFGPVAFMGTLIFGVFLVIQILMLAAALFRGELGAQDWKSVGRSLGIFGVCALLLWYTLSLNRRANEKWASKPEK